MIPPLVKRHDIKHATYAFNVTYESDVVCGKFKWTPEQNQLDRMCRECEPREDLDDMLECAQEIIVKKNECFL